MTAGCLQGHTVRPRTVDTVSRAALRAPGGHHHGASFHEPVHVALGVNANYGGHSRRRRATTRATEEAITRPSDAGDAALRRQPGRGAADA
jgi:hypothetical protein